ncbi:type IV pilin [Natrinema altunense]|uniref:Type IV pilin n=1 Tax=Natrinema altunense TaxID=222984 RepID=A0A482Y0R7_9EURY|nr:type IV pilin N-terminal domain-containing protein [Natrinema altunense]RZH67913.1 type IV pilin [Natrinema altunense]
MIDGKAVRQKLIGSDEERAVSPVIGVILMVAITVILAAVIAAFVLDMGSSVQQEAQGAADINVDEDANAITVEVTSLNNADAINISGIDTSSGNFQYASNTTDVNGNEGGLKGLQVGDTVTLESTTDPNTGTITAVAVLNPGESDEVQTTVGSEEFELGSV